MVKYLKHEDIRKSEKNGASFITWIMNPQNRHFSPNCLRQPLLSAKRYMKSGCMALRNGKKKMETAFEEKGMGV